MSFTKVKAVALALTAVVAVNAQFSTPTNARMAALSGAPMADISDVFSYPVLMLGYTDHAQATWAGSSSYGVLGIKAINDMLAIGFAANQGLMLDHPFTPSFVTAAATVSGITERQYNIPHLLLGFDLGGIKIGADIFFEYIRERYSSEVIGGGLATGSDTHDDTWRLISHPGAKLSVEMAFGDIGVLAKVGAGFPSAKFETKYVDKEPGEPIETTESKRNTTGSIYLEMGAEVSLPLMGFDWVVGAEYAFSSYEREVNRLKLDTTFQNSGFNAYVGCKFSVLETATAALGYEFVRRAGTRTSNSDTTYNDQPFFGLVTESEMNKASNAHHWHLISAGIENGWDDVWILDNLQLRTGMRYNINYRVDRTKSEESGTSSVFGSGSDDGKSRTKGPAIHVVTPTIGVGVSKSYLTLDLNLSMGSWSGLFTGPSVAMVTGTIKF